MSDECIELKNIKYQTMLLQNSIKIYETTPNTENIEQFLEKEKLLNITKPWNKLNKFSKMQKLNQYCKEYGDENKLNDSEIKEMIKYLTTCLERKKLTRQKDVTYDIDNNKIKLIPGLIYNKLNNRFTLKRQDKKTSTLKCLAPKNKTRQKKGKKKDKTKKEKVKKAGATKEKVKKAGATKEKVKKDVAKKEKVKKDVAKKEEINEIVNYE